MPLLKPCLECGKLFDHPKEYRCSECQTGYLARRLQRKPWEKLWHTEEWRRCSVYVKRRDGYRCTWTANGRRCQTTNQTGLISCHHTRKILELWKDAKGAWSVFVRLATNPDICVTLCSRHHHMADFPAEKNTRGWETSGHRRARRHAKRKSGQQQGKTYERDRRDWNERDHPDSRGLLVRAVRLRRVPHVCAAARGRRR